MLEFRNCQLSWLNEQSGARHSWCQIYPVGSWRQAALEEALEMIAADPSAVPSRELEFPEEKVFESVFARASGFADYRRHRFFSGLHTAAEIVTVARILSEQRPGQDEDVAYWQGVGLRVAWRKGTQELLGITPGLIEPFRWQGELCLANPLWMTTVCGEDVLGSGRAFAAALADQGVFCDPHAIGVVLESGLKQQLLDCAVELAEVLNG